MENVMSGKYIDLVSKSFVSALFFAAIGLGYLRRPLVYAGEEPHLLVGGVVVVSFSKD